jgi:UDP-glucose 6-dehydrogenase
VVGFDPTIDMENFKNNWEDEFSLKMLWSLNDIKKERADGIILTAAHSSFRKLSLNDLKNMQGKSPILIDIPGSYDAGAAEKAGFYYRTL